MSRWIDRARSSRSRCRFRRDPGGAGRDEHFLRAHELVLSDHRGPLRMTVDRPQLPISCRQGHVRGAHPSSRLPKPSYCAAGGSLRLRRCRRRTRVVPNVVTDAYADGHKHDQHRRDKAAESDVVGLLPSALGAFLSRGFRFHTAATCRAGVRSADRGSLASVVWARRQKSGAGTIRSS